MIITVDYRLCSPLNQVVVAVSSGGGGCWEASIGRGDNQRLIEETKSATFKSVVISFLTNRRRNKNAILDHIYDVSVRGAERGELYRHRQGF